MQVIAEIRTPRFDLAIPWFAAQDMTRALCWYRDALGFEIRADYGDFGIVVRDRVLINFWLCPDRHIAENTSAYFNVTAVDALADEFRERGASTRLSGPTTFDYGMRELHVWDSEGNLLRLGEPVSA